MPPVTVESVRFALEAEITRISRLLNFQRGYSPMTPREEEQVEIMIRQNEEHLEALIGFRNLAGL